MSGKPVFPELLERLFIYLNELIELEEIEELADFPVDFIVKLSIIANIFGGNDKYAQEIVNKVFEFYEKIINFQENDKTKSRKEYLTITICNGFALSKFNFNKEQIDKIIPGLISFFHLSKKKESNKKKYKFTEKDIQRIRKNSLILKVFIFTKFIFSIIFQIKRDFLLWTLNRTKIKKYFSENFFKEKIILRQFLPISQLFYIFIKNS